MEEEQQWGEQAKNQLRLSSSRLLMVEQLHPCSDGLPKSAMSPLLLPLPLGCEAGSFLHIDWTQNTFAESTNWEGTIPTSDLDSVPTHLEVKSKPWTAYPALTSYPVVHTLFLDFLAVLSLAQRESLVSAPWCSFGWNEKKMEKFVPSSMASTMETLWKSNPNVLHRTTPQHIWNHYHHVVEP